MSAPALVTVLLNTNREAMLHGYRSGDTFIPIHRELAVLGPDHDTHGLAELMFAKFNRDDRPGGSVHRSLSIGDIVQIETPDGPVALTCRPRGFTHVAPIHHHLVLA